ncbi:hypothetical protein IMG5_181350 [Ichthyophthirius multifiliis]|uniref:Tetratricopeptide repeat protein n=1 Tax=Ichthyophthirius multifiliis TaxID=5932 RepID=G0R2T4_ICHMU|nr:hypothetical protein IMG5_181350 [Ichthyophthirius multifiliis]EGR28206.1 hypothetical protein IMG5_181350 [Ichthyophthirius multifiliis]|eukprot:XP_004027551.1 hypothetical protein IMG5_181350 [Ichthyophthirius multifiliis]
MNKNIDLKFQKLKELLENTSENQLQIKLSENEYLKQTILYNKLGCVYFQSQLFEKAKIFLLKSLQIKEQKLPELTYSNIHMNLGNLYAQERNYQKAIEHYLKVIEQSTFNLQNQNKTYEKYELSKQLNSFEAFVDSHTNLSVMYIQIGEKENSIKYCLKTLELNPENIESKINLGDILRQFGKQAEAIDMTWKCIESFSKQSLNREYKRPIQIDIQELNQQNIKSKTNINTNIINIICVKWGTRYDSEYVNKLYRGIKRNTTKQYFFYCFTDNNEGLDQNIIPENLQENWPKWWGKATLFSLESQDLQGDMNFYIDLDMIITGNIDNLLEYQGNFAILNTGDIACEKQHKNGYNSSIIIWNKKCNQLNQIYNELKQNYNIITKFIVRFDYWLEMNIQNADFIQDLFPGQASDYLKECQQQLPQNTKIVCFPRKPKPEDYPSEWIKQYWI